MQPDIRRLAFLAAIMPAIAQADNLSGADRFLCASSLVVRCDTMGECESGPPWEWNMPSFIQVDLKKKVLSTPAASAEQRRSPITVVRNASQIILQGAENGRALSTVIDEETGLASSAIALDGLTGNRKFKAPISGVCQPGTGPATRVGWDSPGAADARPDKTRRYSRNSCSA